ncbi:uncharacterized protein BXZ73DRAFT_83786 [Epithele typhae]|uniref:uncharacterized protein n=1 Tax=Epithele typhae TaxID=378194 RepID=UPI0020085B57|nr:uncharacterized protein BXZ73DRAFT_83786 [Epithele typhae]KAH9910264.1 hypothetical protein BXZ73DRAFT_83786 [Epithele typhae]
MGDVNAGDAEAGDAKASEAEEGDAEGSRGEVKGQDEAEQVVGNAGNAKGEEAQSSEGGRCERKDDVGGGGDVSGGHDVGWDDTEEGRVGGGGGRRRVTRRARGRRRRQRRYADAGDMEVGDDAEVADARGGGGPRVRPRVREAEEGVRARAPEVCRRAARRRAENSAEVGNGEEGSGEVGQADAEIEVKAGGRPDVRSRRGENVRMDVLVRCGPVWTRPAKWAKDGMEVEVEVEGGG